MQVLQDFLTIAVQIIVIGTVLFMTVDFLNQARLFGGHQIPTNWKPDTIVIDITQPIKTEIAMTFAPQEETVPQVNVGSAVTLKLPNPWLADDKTEVSSVNIESAKSEFKHLLLLAPSKSNSHSLSLANVEQNIDQILTEVDFNQLLLRAAHKIAKALDISQKVNGKNQPLSLLKQQIKAKLLEEDKITVETVKDLLVG